MKFFKKKQEGPAKEKRSLRQQAAMGVSALKGQPASKAVFQNGAMASVLTALVLVFGRALTGCSGRRSVTAEDFTAACETAGFTATDSIADFDTSTILTALTVSEENASAGFFIFAASDTARSNYAQMLSGVKTGQSGERFVDSSEYNRFYFSDDSTTTLLYRNGATLIFATGSDTEKLNALVEALGV